MEKNSNLPVKGTRMIAPALMFSIVFGSCQKDVIEPSIETPTATVAASATTGNLLYHETFENSTQFPGLNTQFETSHAFGVATSPVFRGSKSGRFELRDTDPENNGGVRAEVVFPVITNLNRWYSFAVYFPSKDYQKDSEDELIGQWKQHEHDVSSAISLRIKEDRFRLTVFPGYKVTSQKYDLGAIAKDKWLTFVIHIKHSTSSDGLIELWLDGNKIVNRAGSNMYKLSSESGMTNPEWKLGVYKSSWNGSQTSATSKRVLFYDEIKLGNENATLAEMTPAPQGTSTPEPVAPTEPTSPTEPATPTEPTTPSTPPSTVGAITSFTLVSAHTEKDLYTIENGSNISLGPIAVDKLNIKANTSSSYKSVKFELSGKQSKTSFDNEFPFSLHGDSGTGNYYFGNWNPPALGTYTLKATPYTGIKGTGTAGEPSTITFSIVK